MIVAKLCIENIDGEKCVVFKTVNVFPADIRKEFDRYHSIESK